MGDFLSRYSGALFAAVFVCAAIAAFLHLRRADRRLRDAHLNVAMEAMRSLAEQSMKHACDSQVDLDKMRGQFEESLQHFARHKADLRLTEVEIERDELKRKLGEADDARDAARRIAHHYNAVVEAARA